MNRFLNMCSWICIAIVSYKYGYERGSNDTIFDVADWIVSGEASKTMENIAESYNKDIRDSESTNIDTKSLN